MKVIRGPVALAGDVLPPLAAEVQDERGQARGAGVAGQELQRVQMRIQPFTPWVTSTDRMVPTMPSWHFRRSHGRPLMTARNPPR